MIRDYVVMAKITFATAHTQQKLTQLTPSLLNSFSFTIKEVCVTYSLLFLL